MGCRLVFVLLATMAPPATAATLFVSPAGDDGNPGTRSSPLKTISAAAEIAQPGDVVLVREGVYRERVAPPRGGEPGKPIIYRGAPGKRVFVKGSEIWKPEWEDHGNGVFSAVPDERLFDDRSPEYVDDHNPLKVQLASTPWGRGGRREVERGYDGDEAIVYTCGQVFVDGKPLREVPLRGEVAPETWFYEADTGKVFVHFGRRAPDTCLVELTTRRRIFAPKVRGLGHIVVEGFIFEHCGNQYPTNFWETAANAQRGAVGTEAGHHWTIRRNVVRHAKTFAMDVGVVDGTADAVAVHDNVVEENYVLDNGSAGILSCGSLRLTIRDNVILRNNRLRFLGPKRWEQAGIKCHAFRDGTIEGNYIAHNHDTYGVWLDNQFPNSRICRNVIYENGRAGIFLEMSDYEFDTLLVDHNLVLSNRENAVYIHDASGATFVNNLFANTAAATEYGQAVYIRQVSPRTRTANHAFADNLFVGNARNVEVNYPAARSGPQRFDRNLYGVAANARAFAINRKSDVPSPWSPAQFRKLLESQFAGYELTGQAWPSVDRVLLTHDEWRSFWQAHDVENDRHSVLDANSRVSYDPTSHRLTVFVESELTNTAGQRFSKPRTDYFARPWPRGGTTPPGPFIDLESGKNDFTIWSGLAIVDALPPADWNDISQEHTE